MTQTAEPDTSATAERSGRRAGDGRSRPAPEGRARRHEQLVLGATPRAHLLPPEVQADRRAAALHRRLVFAVLAVVAVVARGVLGAGAASTNAQAQLAGAQATTQSLLAQELKFVKVRAVQSQVDLIKTAQEVGASTEIDWKPYLQKVQGTLPAGVTIATVNIDSSTPIELYQQSSASLQGPRVATIVFTAKSPALPVVPSWLDALKTLPGYTDALPGSVALDSASGIYTVTITMHIDARAFSHRFAQKTGK